MGRGAENQNASSTATRGRRTGRRARGGDLAHQRPTLGALPRMPVPTVVPDEEWFQPDPSIVVEATQIARELDYDEIIALRLVMLGLSAQEITDYLNPAPQHILHPERTVPGMRYAAQDLLQGIRDGDKVAVFADYDVDGQTSLAILAAELGEQGAEVHAGSANQRTGFGLTRAYVEEAHAAGAKWLVTVDCGSTQSDPVRLAQSLGMKVIIIDHHDVDPRNTAEHHLNPRLRSLRSLREIIHAMGVAETDEGICKQHLSMNPPYDEQVDRLTERSRRILAEYLEMETGEDGEKYLKRLEDEVREWSHPANTGAMLTWKFAAALQIESGRRVRPAHYGRSLYLAGLGAIADLAPCDNQEVRAFVRVPTGERLQRQHFGNRDIIPPGIQMLAAELGEDASRPDELIRTRALLNLSKRTAEMDPQIVGRLLASDDEDELKQLVANVVPMYERLSKMRREEMDPIVIAQLREAKERAEREDRPETYFAYGVVDGFEDYAGYSRMCANTAVKETGKPAVVFVRKTTADTDEFGQELYKFSGANNTVPEVHLGETIPLGSLQDACKIRMYNWLGEPAEIPNVGGHTEVVSGVCRADQIEAVKQVFEGWAAEKDAKREWRPVEEKRPRIARRLITPSRLRRLEREAPLLAPFSFPESPAIQVSVKGKFSGLRVDRQTEQFRAVLTLEDGSERDVLLSPSAAATCRSHPNRTWEPVIALGRTSTYYISKLADAAS